MQKNCKVAISLLSTLVVVELALVIFLITAPGGGQNLRTARPNGTQAAQTGETVIPWVPDDLEERQMGEAGLAEEAELTTADDAFDLSGSYPAPGEDATPTDEDWDMQDAGAAPFDDGSTSGSGGSAGSPNPQAAYPAPGFYDSAPWGGYPAPQAGASAATGTPRPPAATPSAAVTSSRTAEAGNEPPSTVTAAPTLIGETLAASPDATPTATPESQATPNPTETSPEATPVIVSSVLEAVRAEAAPQIDGLGADAAWEAAPESAVLAGDTPVTLKAVYGDDYLALRITWEDSSPSILAQPWEKQADGSWTLLAGMDGYAGDNLELLWHAASLPESPLADAWAWAAARPSGQLDDLRPEGPGEWVGDPDEGGGVTPNHSDDGSLPAYMPPGGGERSGAPGYILDTEKAPLDEALFQPGDRLPGVIAAPYTGDRADLQAAWTHDGGAWTLEIRRALDTGSANDLAFSDMSQGYLFDLRIYDDTLDNPARPEFPLALVFRR